jgi:nucleoside-diphosphate-sugar epimerase
MGTRVLVTGGSGFLGCYVMMDLVERGDHVINYDIQPLGKEYRWLLGEKEKEIVFERGSIEDLSEIITVIQKHDVEKVVHAAAIVDPPLLSEHPVLAYRVNIGGTINVLEAVRLRALSSVVYISSNGVFTTKKYEPMNEEHPVLLPDEGPGNGPYSISKITCEAFGMYYGDLCDFHFVSLRPSAVYGFGMQYPMYIKPMVENSVQGVATRFETGRDFPRDYTYVKDVSAAVIKALDTRKEALKDRIFLIATGKKLTTPGEIADNVRRLIPSAHIEIGAGFTEWNKREVRYRGMIDISRAREQLGYIPRYDIGEGIEEYVSLFRKYIEEEG